MSSIELERATVASSVSWTQMFQPCASQTKSVGHEVWGAELKTQKQFYLHTTFHKSVCPGDNQY